MPALEPFAQPCADALTVADRPPICTLSPADARTVQAGQQLTSIVIPYARIEGRPVGPKGSMRVRVIRPKSGNRTP
jgi:acetyl esterase